MKVRSVRWEVFHEFGPSEQFGRLYVSIHRRAATLCRLGWLGWAGLAGQGKTTGCECGQRAQEEWRDAVYHSHSESHWTTEATWKECVDEVAKARTAAPDDKLICVGSQAAKPPRLNWAGQDHGV